MKVTREPEAELTVSVDAMVTVVLPTTIGAVKAVTIKTPEFCAQARLLEVI